MKNNSSIIDSLTRRETEIALRIALGRTYVQIARDLRLGFECVRKAVASLRDKTGLRRKVQLGVWAQVHADLLARRARQS